MADDNEFNLYTFEQLILNYNLEADGAFNGKEAVDMFTKSLKCCPYRVIFMDVNMPVMGGLEATQQICKVIEEYKQGKLNVSRG